jgi:hypothetical protein
MSQGGSIANPLVMSELKLEVESHDGVRVTKLPSHDQSTMWHLLPFTPNASKQQSARSHTSALRVSTKYMELYYLKRNLKWHTIPKRCIVRISTDPFQATNLQIDYTTEGAVTLSCIKFDAEAESVCESLVQLLNELLKIPSSSSLSQGKGLDAPHSFHGVSGGGGGGGGRSSVSMPRLDQSHQRVGRSTHSADR